MYIYVYVYTCIYIYMYIYIYCTVFCPFVLIFFLLLAAEGQAGCLHPITSAHAGEGMYHSSSSSMIRHNDDVT